MYKLLLSWRYLRTRYIALASIVSVTLGVATLIVVNSVMAGFRAEMRNRLHGILSDIEVASPSFDGLYDPDWHMQEIRKVVGDDLEAMTAVVRVPGMLHFEYHGRVISQQVIVMGIDDATYAQISDFSEYLIHEDNRRQISFELRDGGYGPRLPESGWVYRRKRVAFEREFNRQLEESRRLDLKYSPTLPRNEAPAAEQLTVDSGPAEVYFAPLPAAPPRIAEANDPNVGALPQLAPEKPKATPHKLPLPTADPFLLRKLSDINESPFDEMNEQYTGVILGIAIANRRYHDPNTNEVVDVFLCQPGDDVQLTIPTVGMPPKPISAKCTVVDFYESKMHEYDASFVFMPLSKLQDLRGMIDPQTGATMVTSIQLKLKPGADLVAARDRLAQRFPPQQYPYQIQTWREAQGPLLAAVQLEITILNILLFMIIAVAGFGILATFFMIVVEKTRDIGILKALGAPSRGVMSIFLGYGLSLGMVGSGVGIALGLLFVANINRIADWIEWLTGQEVFDPTIYYFDKIPTIISPLTIVWVAVGAVAIAVLASVLPAIRAARLHPVEALRI